jgi:hypothetical protein
MITTDIEQLVTNWIMPSRRTTKRLQLIYNFVSPLKYLYNLFVTFGLASLTEAQYTCQTMSMEGALNDKLDSTDRRIWIENTYFDRKVNYIYPRAEYVRNFYIYRRADIHTPVFIYRRSDYVASYDFIVHIPVAAGLDEVVVTAIVNKYRKAGKRFIIQTF